MAVRQEQRRWHRVTRLVPHLFHPCATLRMAHSPSAGKKRLCGWRYGFVFRAGATGPMPTLPRLPSLASCAAQ